MPPSSTSRPSSASSGRRERIARLLPWSRPDANRRQRSGDPSSELEPFRACATTPAAASPSRRSRPRPREPHASRRRSARRNADPTPACTTRRAPRRCRSRRATGSARRRPTARRPRPAPRRRRSARARRAARPRRGRSGAVRHRPRSERGSGRASAASARSRARGRSHLAPRRLPPRRRGCTPRSSRCPSPLRAGRSRRRSPAVRERGRALVPETRRDAPAAALPRAPHRRSPASVRRAAPADTGRREPAHERAWSRSSRRARGRDRRAQAAASSRTRSAATGSTSGRSFRVGVDHDAAPPRVAEANREHSALPHLVPDLVRERPRERPCADDPGRRKARRGTGSERSRGPGRHP